jgi:hypothetical protein
VRSLEDIARGVAARLTPSGARREIAWLMYKIEMDYLQDISDRPEVYRQAVQDALPTLRTTHRDMLALVWEDCEERLARQWDKLEPPNPEREAEIWQRAQELRASGDETTWYKALRAPHEAIEEPDYERIREVVRSVGGDKVEAVFTELFDTIQVSYRSGEYDEYLLRRGASQWPDVTQRRPVDIFGFLEPEE